VATQPTSGTVPTTRPSPPPAGGAKVKQLGVIGVDSSHLPEFARRINTLHREGRAAVQVTQCWTDGRHDMPESDVEQWLMRARAEGVERAEDLDAMLEAVDGVLVLGVNGHKHLEQATPALERGLPTYIDKPLTCDLGQARQILERARKTDAPCYSASSLRFAPEVEAVRAAADRLGELATIDAFGPGELNESMRGLFFYGVHTIEMVDAIWGPGVERVRAVGTEDRAVVEPAHPDGRFPRLRTERRGAYAFGATVHGTRAVEPFVVDFAPVYDRLIAGMVRFFEGGDPPAPLRDIVENIAVIEAAHRSMERDGQWTQVESIR